MHGKLVDSEDYPRSDIDVYSVRTARHRIICKWILYQMTCINCNKMQHSPSHLPYPVITPPFGRFKNQKAHFNILFIIFYELSSLLKYQTIEALKYLSYKKNFLVLSSVLL